ncbi:MAG: SGNH/GDSL hydrolase family protein, partial [Planctomycetaceae bacterium]
EPEVATLIAELTPSVIVLDCLPNITAADVRARTGPVVAILRKRHPQTPILLVEDRSYADAFLIESKRIRNASSRAALRDVFNQLRSDGDRHIFYLKGEDLLGNDGEGTVDSSHPTDLGFLRQAEAFRRVLEPILAKQSTKTD